MLTLIIAWMCVRMYLFIKVGILKPFLGRIFLQWKFNTYRIRHVNMCIYFKVRGAYEDLYMSHSSWFTYQATNRIYKHYDFNIDDPLSAAKRMAFSSYPGVFWDILY